MGAWGIVGSLIGNRIHAVWVGAEHSWLGSWQHMLMRSAHAHMNTMAILAVVIGLVGAQQRQGGTLEAKIFRICCSCYLVGVLLMGIGLVHQAFFEPQNTDLTAGVLCSGLGGFLFIASVLGFGSLCYQNYRTRTQKSCDHS